MLYQSTRGGESGLTFEEVVFSSYAKDGGLYVPMEVPKVSKTQLESWQRLRYEELCCEILGLFVSDALKEKLPDICAKAFRGFYVSDVAPLTMLSEGFFSLELCHGPTLAFKDLGLNILAQMMDAVMHEYNAPRIAQGLAPERANVVCETSGDTGPAAVAAVCNAPRYLNIFCIFPRRQVTRLQARQLTTMMPKHSNVRVYATDRNSDDQCLFLKQRLFTQNHNKKNHQSDSDLIKRYRICAMNSINWVRIASQIVYYFWSYFRIADKQSSDSVLLSEIDLYIPSGAFGNSCAACFAKYMGCPIRKIIPSTNENDIVYRTLMIGQYSMNESDYHHTLSPAMDVQIAYNLERFFWLAFDQDCTMVKKIQSSVEQSLSVGYQFNDTQIKKMNLLIESAMRTSDDDIRETIVRMHNDYGYLVCPHSACAFSAALKSNHQNDVNDGAMQQVPLVCVCTAHPSKFPEIVTEAFSKCSSSSGGGRITVPIHPALPKDSESEHYTLLRNSRMWMDDWEDILKRDIVRLNETYWLLSKL